MDDGKAHAGRGAEPPAETALTGSESHPRVPNGSLADARLRAPGAGPARVAMALALQRGLGNAAVQRTLAPRGPLPALLMRAPPTAPEKAAEAAPSGLSLPEGTNFEWGRSGMDFAVVVRRQWLLDNGAAPDDTRISDVRVVRPLVLGVGTVAPWAKKDDLEAMITSNMRVSIGGAIKDRPEFFAVPLEDFSKRFIGNPPGEDVVVSVRTNEVAIFVDKALVTKHAAGPDATVVLDEAFNARVFAAVEATSGLTLGKHKAPGFRTEIYKEWRWPLNGPAKDVHKTVLVTLAEEDMTDLFGPQWGELQAKPTGEVVAGQVQGRPVMLPADQQASHAKIIKLLNDLFGPAGKEKPAPDAKPIYLGGQALELLEQIAKEKDPRRAELLARLRRPTAGQAEQSLEEYLSTVIAEQDSEEARKRLGLKNPKDAADSKPVENRPVHGRIINHGGRPVPKQPVRFTFEVLDDVDAFRAPWIDIRWMATFEKGGNRIPVDSEVTSYSPLRGDRVLNDKSFEVTFPSVGTFVVDAFVNHNFFRPAHFKADVRVLSEGAEVEHLEGDALKGFALPGKEEKTTFDVGSITGALTSYEHGSVTRGKLDPGYKPETVDERLAGVDAEITRVETLQQEFGKRQGAEATQVVKWAGTYLKTLREGRRSIVGDTLVADAKHVPVQGVYVSRSKGVRSGALSLLCLLTRTASGYKVVLHDMTQLYEASSYRFEAEAAKPEQAFKAVFTDHASSYPDGSLSETFTAWDEKTQALGTTYVQFEKRTDTLGKDVKSVVFDTAVSVVVNLAALVLTVFPPTAPLGIGIAIAYNSAQTISELEEKAAKGALKDKDIAVAVGSMALDLLPVIGRSARVVTLGRKAFYVIEGVQWAGQAVLLTEQGFEEIDRLRNGVMSRLADNVRQIQAIEAVNKADPKLDVLRAEQERLITEAREASTAVFSQLALRHAVMMVGGAIVQESARKALGTRIKAIEDQGRFDHKHGQPARFDYDQRKVVGDREKVTPFELERIERQMGLSDKLERVVSDPARRQTLVDVIGAEEVEIRVGGKKTRLELEGDKKVLHVAENAAPADILSEAYRIKSGTAAPEGGVGKTPVEKAAFHKNELTHLEDLRKRVQDGEAALDDFTIDTKIRNQFSELERTLEKMPPDAKGRQELADWVERFRRETYEPAAALPERLRRAHSGLPETYQKLSGEQRRVVRAMADEGLAVFSRLPAPKREAFLSLPETALDTFNRNPGPRQAALLRDVDSLVRGAKLDEVWVKTDDAGVAHTREGHPFERHGPHVSEADMYKRARADGQPISRWSNVAEMEAEIAHRRRTMMDPATVGNHSAINADGRHAIAQSQLPVHPGQPPRTPLTAADILADPVRYRQYLKRKVDFKEVSSRHGRPVGEEFDPDGSTRRPVDTVTVIFELDDAGRYHVITAFPEKP